MKRILLINEDYNEQRFLDTLLKKIGFDILPLRNDVSLPETLLSFKPDVVMATGDGVKINGVKIAEKMKKRGSHAKLILLMPAAKLKDEKLMKLYARQTIIEVPVNPRTLIPILCDATGLNTEGIMQKFERLPIASSYNQEKKSDSQMIQSQKFSLTHPERKAKYSDIIKSSPQYDDHGFPKEKVAEVTKEMQKYESEHPDLKTLDEHRKDFVVRLFKKTS